MTSSVVPAPFIEHIYAPPLIFCPWRTVGVHRGKSRTTISFKPTGDSMVFAQVRYRKFSFAEQKAVEDFSSGDVIATAEGNYEDTIEIRFKAVPTGTNVEALIEFLNPR